MKTFKQLLTVLILTQLPALLLTESFELKIITPAWNNSQEMVISTALRVPSAERSYVLGLEVFQGQEHLHHAVLYAFERLSYTSQEENEVYSAENQTVRSSLFWTNVDVGSSLRREIFLDSKFIKSVGYDIGLEVGSRSNLNHFKISLHASGNGKGGQVGFKLSMATEVELIGRALTFNPRVFSIPPGQNETISCASQVSISGNASLVGYHIHSHHFGKLVYLHKLYGDQRQTIVRDIPNGHRTYMMLPPEKRTTVVDGDILDFGCEMINTSNQTVTYGNVLPGDNCEATIFYAMVNQEPLPWITRTPCLEKEERKKALEEKSFFA